MICILFVFSCSTNMKTDLTFRVGIAPTSADPLEYDFAVHHVIFRSVLGGLVTQYKNGGFHGEIAESWEVSNSGTLWKFKIKPEARFENGDKITPSIIVKSWSRLQKLLEERRSESEFFKILNKLVPNDNNGTLEIELNEPFPKLLETISFGLYSIVHPSNYDAVTGVWKDPKSVISSNSYKISDWKDSELTLILRDDFPSDTFLPNAFKKIIIQWKLNKLDSADMALATSISNIQSNEFSYYGNVNSSMAYLYCAGWNNPKSICHDSNNRRAIREEYYKQYDKLGIKPIRSFFPLAIKGVKEAGSENGSIDIGKINRLVYFNVPPEKNEHTKLFHKFNEVSENVAVNLKLKPEKRTVKNHEEYKKIKDPDNLEFTLDVMIGSSGVLVDDPKSDIRFMFLSKEGIQLPDLDGSIKAMLSEPDFDIQKVNERLWEQAVVWPVTHFSMGVWAKDFVDVSHLNLLLPPIQFQWIGSK